MGLGILTLYTLRDPKHFLTENRCYPHPRGKQSLLLLLGPSPGWLVGEVWGRGWLGLWGTLPCHLHLLPPRHKMQLQEQVTDATCLAPAPSRAPAASPIWSLVQIQKI